MCNVLKVLYDTILLLLQAPSKRVTALSNESPFARHASAAKRLPLVKQQLDLVVNF